MAISFKGAHFPQDIILMGVRWYLAYLSFPKTRTCYHTSLFSCPSSSPFTWRHFEPAIIVSGVRWYLRYAHFPAQAVVPD